jgi:hypothetical protein
VRVRARTVLGGLVLLAVLAGCSSGGHPAATSPPVSTTSSATSRASSTHHDAPRSASPSPTPTPTHADFCTQLNAVGAQMDALVNEAYSGQTISTTGLGELLISITSLQAVAPPYIAAALPDLIDDLKLLHQAQVHPSPNESAAVSEVQSRINLDERLITSYAAAQCGSGTKSASISASAAASH